MEKLSYEEKMIQVYGLTPAEAEEHDQVMKDIADGREFRFKMVTVRLASGSLFEFYNAFNGLARQFDESQVTAVRDLTTDEKARMFNRSGE